MVRIKTVVIILKILGNFTAHRNFGNITLHCYSSSSTQSKFNLIFRPSNSRDHIQKTATNKLFDSCSLKMACGI